MKRKFIDTLGEFLLKILMFGAIMFFVGDAYSKEPSDFFAIYWTIILCMAFYGLFIYDILHKKEQEEDENYEFLKKYIYENYVEKKKKNKEGR